MSTPLVSIIINCHNGEKYLNECLDSIILQSYKNWEIIFWDNKSEDKSKSIFDMYSRYNTKYFYSENFLNLYEARNLAIEKASGKYICFLDVDDFWEKDKLKFQVNFLEKNKNFEMVYSKYYTFNEKKKKKFIQNNFELPSGKITKNLLSNYSIGILTICLKRNIFEKKKFNKKFNIIGDFDFFLKLSKIIDIGCIQKPLANYRLHNDNYSTKKIDLYIKELKNWIKDNEDDFLKDKFSLFGQKILLLKLSLKKYLSYLGV